MNIFTLATVKHENSQMEQQTDNSDHYVDEFGTEDVAFVLKESELGGLHQPLDFWALSADVQEMITDALDEIESN